MALYWGNMAGYHIDNSSTGDACHTKALPAPRSGVLKVWPQLL